MRLLLLVLLLGASLGNDVLAESPAWQDVLPAIKTATAVAGTWTLQEKSLKVTAANGARLALPVVPSSEYDFRVSFTRHTGSHSIALIFLHGGKQATFEIDAWSQHLAGIQNIDGKDLKDNPTRKKNQTLENGRRYTMTIEVRTNQVRCLLDDTELVIHQTDGSDLSMSAFWRMPQATHLGIGAWNSETTFHSVEVRSRSDKPLQLLTSITNSGKKTSTTRVTPTHSMPTPASVKSAVTSKKNKNSKHVLIVLANQDFFYREYADPRAELERAGIRVSVAAGTKAACRPHANSGQGGRSGIVQPDLTLAQVDVKNYDAILFSGGWGSSSYQFAFTGRYNNRSYNGNPAIKKEANRVINEFLAADKYTCALCNAVSVLAWARVNGKSPLTGKRVFAPTRAAASGIYNGRQAQPSCRWHPEVNGARLSPAGSIGHPNTAADDVIVDGIIITGEDDISAREMGRRIAQVLLK